METNWGYKEMSSQKDAKTLTNKMQDTVWNDIDLPNVSYL